MNTIIGILKLLSNEKTPVYKKFAQNNYTASFIITVPMLSFQFANFVDWFQIHMQL